MSKTAAAAAWYGRWVEPARIRKEPPGVPMARSRRMH